MKRAFQRTNQESRNAVDGAFINSFIHRDTIRDCGVNFGLAGSFCRKSISDFSIWFMVRSRALHIWWLTVATYLHATHYTNRNEQQGIIVVDRTHFYPNFLLIYLCVYVAHKRHQGISVLLVSENAVAVECIKMIRVASSFGSDPSPFSKWK